MWSYDTEADTPLVGDIDVESRLARVPRSYTLKGMFFGSLVASLGDDGWEAIRPQLRAAPRFDRYVPFSDYPQVDYCRIAVAAAARLHPDVDLPEAARRLARGDFAVFARSRVGAVLMSLAGDLPTVLSGLPSLYQKVTRGGNVESERLDGGGVSLRYTDYHGWVDCYTLGTIEGVVMHFGQRPHIRVSLESETRATYDVRWD